MQWIKKFDEFSLRFSYTGKVKLLLLIYVLITYAILSFLITLQEPLLTLTQRQLTALPYISLIEAAQKSALYAFTRDTMSNNDLALAATEMEAHLIELGSLPDTQGTNFFIDPSESVQEWTLHLTQALQLWQEIVKSKSKLNVFNQNSPFQRFQQELHAAWQLLSEGNTGLFLMDLGTHRLAQIFTQDLMELQEDSSRLIQMLLTPMDQRPHDSENVIRNLKESLVMNMKQINHAFEESIQENPMSPTDQKALSLDGYLAVLSRAVDKVAKLDSTNTDVETLYFGSQLQNNILQFGLQLNERIHNLVVEQQNTLLYRQWFSLISILFGGMVFALFYFTRVIRRPLANIRNATEELVKGNLYVRTKVLTKDETGDIAGAFNHTVELIEKIIVHASGITRTLVGSSQEISVTAKNLRQNVVDQEKSIQQIIANARGIKQTVKDCASFLQDVNKSAVNTSLMAAEGRESLIEMESIMQQLLNASHKINSTLDELRKKILTTTTVIQTVVRISDQSNLLALNSSLRTNNTGLQQSGFGVIADKIRELADQTAFVTLKMEKEVNEIMSALANAEEIVHTFSQEIESEVREAFQVRENFKKLIWNVQEQVKAFDSINHEMQQQASNAGEIHETVFELKDLSKKTTQSSARLNDEIEFLSNASEKLNEMIKEFKTSAEFIE